MYVINRYIQYLTLQYVIIIVYIPICSKRCWDIYLHYWISTHQEALEGIDVLAEAPICKF